MLYITFFLALLLTPLTAQATITSGGTTLIKEDFEGYANQAAFEAVWPSSCPGAPSILGLDIGDASKSHSGTTSLHLHTNDGVNTCFINENFPNGGGARDVWVSYWHKADSGWLPNTTVGSKQIMLKTNSGSSEFILHNFANRNDLGVSSYSGLATVPCPVSHTPDTNCNFYPNMGSKNIQDTFFHCIEGHIVLGTPGVGNGQVETFVDGAQQTGYYNIYTQGSDQPAGAKIVDVTFYAQNGTGTRHWDDAWVSTVRTGCSGGSIPPPADNGLPSVPTGLIATPSGTNVSLQWVASMDTGGSGTPSGIANYPVLRCAGNGCTPSTLLTAVNAPTVSFVDTTVVAGVIYNYAVRAVDNASPANISAATTAVQITAPTTFRRTLSTFACGSDTITDIGSTWDAGYTTKTNLGCTSGRLRAVSTVTTSLESFNTGGAIGDQWAQFTVFTLPTVSTSDVSVAVRMADAATNSYYACRLQDVTPRTLIEKRSAGTGSTLVSTAAYDSIWAVNDKIRCEATGTAPVTIKFYRIAAGTNVETLVLSDASDSAFTTGKTGLRLSASVAVTSPEVGGFAMGDFQAAAAVASITVDAVSSSASTNTTNTISWTHTTGSCTNRLLVVATQARDDASAADTVASSVSYQGAALTAIRSDLASDGASATSLRSSLWYLINPGSGAGTVAITWAGALSRVGVGSAISLCGVDQTTPNDANAGGNATSGTAISSAITTVANNAFIVDTFATRPGDAVTLGAGQTERVNRTVGSTITVGMSTVSAKTPAGAETMDWTKSTNGHWTSSSASFLPATVTPIVEPNILTMTLGVSGSSAISGITYNATTPTQIRVHLYSNGGLFQDIVRPIADFAGGNFSYTWPNGYDGVCLFPINSIGTEINTPTSVYQCRSPIPGTTAADTTPIVMTQTLPTGTLNKDTTTTTFALTFDKSGSFKWDTVNTTYALMANIMSVSSFTASASTGAILSNGTTTHVYAQACFTNSVGTDICTTTALDIPISVAAGVATDTTAPTAPTNLAAGTPFQNQVPLAWTASTDAVGVTSYQVFTDVTGLCTTWTAAGLPVTTTTTIYNLPQSTPISFMVRARDAAGNVSSDSNCTTSTTLQSVDATPPSTMTNLQVVVNLKASIVLGYDQGTDDRGAVTTIIEQCTGAGCTNFAVVHAPQVGLNQVLVNLTPGTAYRLRGLFSDPSGNVSVAYSNIVDVTTMTTGLPQLRTPLPFGVTRTPLTVLRTSVGATRTPRPQ